MQIVLIPGHGDDLWNDGLLRPVGAELHHQLLEVVGGRFANGEDVVDQPSHAQRVQLLVEELNAKLTWKNKKINANGKKNGFIQIIKLSLKIQGITVMRYSN